MLYTTVTTRSRQYYNLKRLLVKDEDERSHIFGDSLPDFRSCSGTEEM